MFYSTYRVSMQALLDDAKDSVSDANKQKKSPKSLASIKTKLAYLIILFLLFAILYLVKAPAPVFLISIALVYILQKHLEKSRLQKELKELEFFLPIVMEKMVMAVQAGLDIVPAMKVITEKDRNLLDPASKLIKTSVELIESGVSVKESLQKIAENIESPALKHAFIHLSVAHEEGGELVMPLRELSDATQLHYQESAEEDVAKLPVMAVMPLMLTFAGLILVFITSPLLQVIGIVSKTTLPH